MYFATAYLLASLAAPILELRWDASASAGVQDGTGTWDAATTANWTANGGSSRRVWLADIIARFGGGASGTAGTVTVSGTVNAKKIISNAPFAGTYTLASGTIAMTGIATVEANAAMTISAVLSGSAGLTKTGSATLTASGANTYTGTTTVSAGTLSSTAYSSTSGASGLGAATNPIVVASGATLELAATGGRTTLVGNISGSGNISQNHGTNSVLLGGNNSSFTGVYTKTNSASVQFCSASSGSAAAYWTTTGTPASSAFVARYGATPDAWNTGIASGSNPVIQMGSFASSDTGCSIGNFTSAASQVANTTFEIGDLGQNETVAAAFVDTLAGSTAFTSSVVNIRKVGSGTWTLSGTNTYTGTTTVNGGTLKAGASASGKAFGTLSAVTLANTSGVILHLNDFNQTIGSLAGGGGTGGNVTLGTGTLTMGGDNTSTSYAGVISGTGHLTKVGNGTQILSGANTFSGICLISAGVLEAPALSAIGTGTGSGNYFAIQGGSTFRYTGTGSESLTNRYIYWNSSAASIEVTSASGTLTLGVTGGTRNQAFTKTGAGTLAFDTTVIMSAGSLTCAAGTFNVASVMSGTVAVTVSGGTMTMSGTNTYTGTTTVNGGILYVSGALGATAITVANTTGSVIGVGSAATKTATTSTLTMSGANAAINVHTNGTTVASRLDVTGAFSAGGCTVNVLGAVNIGSYTIVSAGSSSGTTPVLGTNSSGHAVTFTLIAGVLTMIVA